MPRNNLYSRDRHSSITRYASWCGHCNHFKPEVAKLGEMLASSKHPVRLGRVDYEENPVIISRFFTASLPTVYQYVTHGTAAFTRLTNTPTLITASFMIFQHQEPRGAHN